MRKICWRTFPITKHLIVKKITKMFTYLPFLSKKVFHSDIFYLGIILGYNGVRNVRNVLFYSYLLLNLQKKSLTKFEPWRQGIRWQTFFSLNTFLLILFELFVFFPSVPLSKSSLPTMFVYQKLINEELFLLIKVCISLLVLPFCRKLCIVC